MPARSPSCALSTMTKLAWAYLDQAASGDFARSSIVLAKFASTYSGVRSQIATATGVDASRLPATLEQYFSPNTSGVLGFVLSSLAVDDQGQMVNPALRAAVLQIGQRTAANVGELYRTQIDPAVPSSAAVRGFVSLVRNTDPSSLSVALDGAIAEGFECAPAQSYDSMIRDLASRPTQNAPRTATATPRTPTELEPITIRARSGSSSIPPWMLYGAAALAIGAAGWALYGAAK